MNLSTLLPQLSNTYSYKEFKALIQRHAEAKSTSGDEQSAERIEATKLNFHRINRIEKQFLQKPELFIPFEKNAREQTWILLAETWCGDMSQNLPLIGLIAERNPKIKLLIALRDENPEIMDLYLTNGSRSIPKLICYDDKSGDENGSWGPRPTEITREVIKLKNENPGISHENFVRQVQVFYAKNRGISLLCDMAMLCNASYSSV